MAAAAAGGLRRAGWRLWRGRAGEGAGGVFVLVPMLVPVAVRAVGGAGQGRGKVR